MNGQVEIGINFRRRDHGNDSVWPTVIRGLLVFCAAAAVALLLITESRLPLEQRQQTFEASGVYP